MRWPSNQGKIKWRWGFVAILVAALIFVLLFIFRPGQLVRQPTVKPQLIHAITLKTGNYQPQILLFATLQSTRHTQLTAPWAGDVKKILVQDGQAVKKGQLLVQLDDEHEHLTAKRLLSQAHEKEAQLEQLRMQTQTEKKNLSLEKQRYEIAKTALNRQKQLHKQGHTSLNDVDKARKHLAEVKTVWHKAQLHVEHASLRLEQKNHQWQQAQYAWEQAELILAEGQVKAPFDGLVTHVDVASGNRVPVGALLLTLVDTYNQEARALLPDKYVSWVKESLRQKKIVTVLPFAQKASANMQIKSLSGQIKTGHLGREVIFSIQGANEWVEGKTLPVLINRPVVSGSFVIPAAALYQHNVVYAVRDGYLKRCVVHVDGEKYHWGGHTQWVVSSNEITNGEKVLSQRLPQAIDGLRVKVVSREVKDA